MTFRNGSKNLATLAFSLAAFFACFGCDDGGDGDDGSSSQSAHLKGSVQGGGPVEGARVALVDAAAVEASESIQPVEDLAPVSSLAATTDSRGKFSLEVPAGRYFVFVTPAAEDAKHLPGGSLLRESFSLGSGASTVVGIQLSERPPDDAVHVGSTVCLGCHPSFSGVSRTLHAVGLRRLGPAGSELSALQDLGAFPGADAALADFVDGGANDNTGAGDGYGLRVPAGAFNVLTGKDGVGYFQVLESPDGARVSTPYYVELTYGGAGRFRQLFVTRVDTGGAYTADAAAGSYQLLPAQFVETQGEPSRGAEITVPTWSTFEPEAWAPPAAGGQPAGTWPPPEQSFDVRCAGCHVSGMSLTRDAAGLFHFHAAPDPGGTFDVDGDGVADELSAGCESCHGPGSAHAAAAQGQIVQPDFLPSGRGNLVCGRCHARGFGNATIGGAGHTEYPSRDHPVSGELELPRPGLTPAEFFGTPDGTGLAPDFGTQGGFLNAVDLATDPEASWRDQAGGFGARFNHSRLYRQHYFEHVRSGHGRNASQLLTCWDCHAAHSVERQGQLREDATTNLLCVRCHAGSGDFASVGPAEVQSLATTGQSGPVLSTAIDEHTILRTFDLIGVAMNLGPPTYNNPSGASQLGRCTTCHMPRTARSGGWVQDDQGFVIRGDISAHSFDNVSPATGRAMAEAGQDPVINSCVECHRGVPRGAYPDYRYRKEE